MNTQEFSDAFDVLLNSYATEANFGEGASRKTITLDEYEKSVFLTRAQEALVEEFYSGRNVFGESFESTEEFRRSLGNLIVTAEILQDTTYQGKLLTPDSKAFKLPDDLWLITYEAVTVNSTNTCLNNKVIKVVPVTQDEFSKIKENPFRCPSIRQIPRLDLNSKEVELICPYSVGKYTLRYLKELSPIVLEDMPDGLSINGVSQKTECMLIPSIHSFILERAVRMAFQSRMMVSGERETK